MLEFNTIDEKLTKTVYIYFSKHASKWLNSKNTSLSIYSKLPPYTKEELGNMKNLPNEVDIKELLFNPSSYMENFFTCKSKAAHLIENGDINR